MEVDFWGHAGLTRQILPFMVKAVEATSWWSAVLTGLFGFPQRSAHAAAKHALHGYFEHQGSNISRDNIRAAMVCPGMVKTNISIHSLISTGGEQGL